MITCIQVVQIRPDYMVPTCDLPQSYRKTLRTGTRIDFSYLHDIAYIFLPLKNLYEEAFNIKTIEF